MYILLISHYSPLFYICFITISVLLFVTYFIFTVMTIHHRGTRSRSTTSSVARENTTSSHNEPAESSAASEQSLGHLRGCADLPPTIPNEQDRPLIEPQGKS